jgi:predicted MPP superfamily phosphohydrolase
VKKRIASLIVLGTFLAVAQTNQLAVDPFLQLVGDGQLGVGWQASTPSFGTVNWKQDQPAWQKSFYAEDGLKEFGEIQRASIDGYVPTKPLEFFVESKECKKNGLTIKSEVLKVPPILSEKGETSFLMITDIHSRPEIYAPLIEKTGKNINFIALGGDCIQNPASEKAVVDALTKPMAALAKKGLPFLFLRGNHETRGDYGRFLRNHLILPREGYYGALTLGNLRLIHLDCGEDKPDDHVQLFGITALEPHMKKQAEWLKQETKSEAFKNAKFRVVLIHIPVNWNLEQNYWATTQYSSLFTPTLNESGIHAVISGHTHKSNLLQSPTNAPVAVFKGPVFIGASWPLEKHVVTRVDVQENEMSISLIKADGTVTSTQQFK